MLLLVGHGPRFVPSKYYTFNRVCARLTLTYPPFHYTRQIPTNLTLPQYYCIAIMSDQVEWLAQIWDKPDVLKTRFQHGAEHMAYHQPNRDSGRLVFSGPTLKTHVVTPGSTLQVTGSVLVFRLTGGEKEVRKILEEDPLAKAGVWDLEGATITPFKLFSAPQ